MANMRPLVLDDLGGGAGAMREAGDGELSDLINSPYCTCGGTANAIALTVNDTKGTPSAYVDGAQYRFRATSANSGATTINVAGLGAKPCVTVTGAALPAGYIRTGVDTVITYDAANNRFVVGREDEVGSNSNGDFIRFANGWQIILKILTGSFTAATPYGAVYASPKIVGGTMAAVFVNPPATSVTLESSASVSMMMEGLSTTSTLPGVYIVAYPGTTTTGNYRFCCTSEGYWYL